MYDIVYSVIFHQEINLVNHFLKNIEKFNKNNNYLVIIHLSIKLFKIKDKIYKKNVIINPIHYNKKHHNHLLIKSVIENFEYLISQKISFKNFMTLNSSNRLVRQAPKFEKQNIKFCENKVIQNIKELNKNWSHWPNFLKNKKIVNIFKNHKIKIICGQVSGRLYSKELMEKIVYFIRIKKLLKIIQCETVFCEIILPSLAGYYIDIAKQKVYCHTFWDKPKSIPTVNEVINLLKTKPNIYIIKRFPDNINHILFKALENNKFTL